jgi:TP901 family phage tail tape measure protein
MAAMSVFITASLIDMVSGPLKAIQANLLGLNKSATAANAALATGANSSAAALGTVLSTATKLRALSMGLGGAAFAAGLAGKDEAIAYDAAMTRVRKIMNLSRGEFGEYKDAMMELTNEFPIKFEDVADSFSFAARLNQDPGFMRQWAKLTADTMTAYDISSEKAASMMKNIMNAYNYSTDQKGLARVENVLDQINTLDNQFKGATASNIMEFVNRTAGIGKMANLSAGELAAVGATYEALGQPVERTARTFSNSLVYMMTAGSGGKKAQAAIKKLGYKSVDTFKKALEKDGMGAFLKMMEAAGKLGETDRINALAGIFGTQQARELSRLGDTKSLELLRLALSKVRGELAGVAKEAEQARDTYEKRMSVAANRWRNMWASLGTPVLPAIGILSEKLSLIAVGIEKAAREAPTLLGALQSFGAFSVTGGLAAMAVNVGVLKMGFAAAAASAVTFGWNVGLAGAAIFTIYTYWDQITAAIQKANEYAGQFVSTWQNEGFLSALEKVKADMLDIVGNMGKVWSDPKYNPWVGVDERNRQRDQENEAKPQEVPGELPRGMPGGTTADTPSLTEWIWNKLFGSKTPGDEWSATKTIPGEPATIPGKKGGLKDVPGISVAPAQETFQVEIPPPEVKMTGKKPPYVNFQITVNEAGLIEGITSVGDVAKHPAFSDGVK